MPLVSKSAQIRLATTSDEIARCYPVMHQLRPTLLEGDFVARIQLQQSEGYRLACLEHNGCIVSLAGFRIFSVIYSGRTLYVDDLITDAAYRSQGFGEAMMNWLVEHAAKQSCDTFSLDSGTSRQQTHAFYFRHGLRITAFHFQMPLK
jgi:GNAT superfamily N-acetyltransferase